MWTSKEYEHNPKHTKENVMGGCYQLKNKLLIIGFCPTGSSRGDWYLFHTYKETKKKEEKNWGILPLMVRSTSCGCHNPAN